MGQASHLLGQNLRRIGFDIGAQIADSRIQRDYQLPFDHQALDQQWRQSQFRCPTECVLPRMFALQMHTQEHPASTLSNETESPRRQLLALPDARPFPLLTLGRDPLACQRLVLARDKRVQPRPQIEGTSPVVIDFAVLLIQARGTDDKVENIRHYGRSVLPETGRPGLVATDHSRGLGIMLGRPFQGLFSSHLLAKLRFGPIDHAQHHQASRVDVQGQLDLMAGNLAKLRKLGLTHNGSSAGLIDKLGLSHYIELMDPPTFLPSISISEIMQKFLKRWVRI